MSRWLAVVALVASVSSARAQSAATPCKPAAASTKLTLAFQGDTPITDLVTWVVGFTCKTVVMDAEAKARVPKVSITAPKALTPKQALQLFVDAAEATGLTVKQRADTIIISLGPSMRDCTATASSTSSVPAVADTPPASAPTELDKLVDAGIKKQSETSYEISAKLVDAILANPMAVSKGARVVPSVKDGKPAGFKLYAIRPSSVFAKLGLSNGDTIQKVNGFELTSADKALEVYSSLRDAKSLTVSIERRGKPVTLTYTIK